METELEVQQIRQELQAANIRKQQLLVQVSDITQNLQIFLYSNISAGNHEQ